MDKIAFYPYFYVKDLVGWVAFAIFFSIWIFYAPNVLGHPDNLCYFVCLSFSYSDLFCSMLGTTAFSLSGRAISLFLLKLGCSAEFSKAIGFAVKTLLTSGVEPNMMNPSTESSPAPSALEERTNELIIENLTERKGDIGTGQTVDEVRQGVEHDLNIETKTDAFLLIQELEKEVKAKNEPCPGTTCAFNEVKEHESQRQDGKKSNDCSLQEKDE